MPSIARVLATTVAVALLVGCGPDDEVAQVAATPLAVPSPSVNPEPSPTDDPSPLVPTPEPSVDVSPPEVTPKPSPERSPEPRPEPSSEPSTEPSPPVSPEPTPERDPEEARAREVIAAYDGQLVDDGTMVTVPNDQLFETGTIYLRDEADAILEDLLIPVEYYLERDDDVRIVITVHTDDRDDPEYSQYFSQERAQFTRKGFQDAGVPKQRMEAIGAGSSEPVADNSTAAGREANRRTELVLVGVDAITD